VSAEQAGPRSVVDGWMDELPTTSILGVWDVPEAAYHADPVPGGSMSSTLARKILAPGCPALVRWAAENPPAPKSTFDLGSATHKLVLGKGAALVEIEHNDYRTAKAQQSAALARLDGKIPLLSKEMRAAEAMAEAIMAHPLAARLLAPGLFVPEGSIYWLDPVFGIWRRAMVDAISDIAGRPLLVDVKTTVAASPKKLPGHIADYGYHQQADWYLSGAAQIGIRDAGFLYVFVEKTPPHLVTVVQLDTDSLVEGHRANDEAMALWARCRESGHWPGYSDNLLTVSLPPWHKTHA